MIRIALVVCCAALAAADADADALYGAYGYSGLGYSGIGYSGYGYASPAISYATPAVTYGYSAPVATTAAYGYAAPAQGAAIAVRGYGTAATVDPPSLMDMLPVVAMLLTLLELSTLPREKLMRMLMLMPSTVLMDIAVLVILVLDTLAMVMLP